MFKVLRDWMQRYFSDEEAVVLAVLLFLALLRYSPSVACLRRCWRAWCWRF